MTNLPEISVGEVLSHRIADCVQDLTRQDTALYALSVGFARDPLNDIERRFVDPAVPMRVSPSQALILGYPGFWLGEGPKRIDPTRIIHAAQTITLTRPLMDEGRITGRTRITGLYRRSEEIESGLALTSVRELLDEEGRQFATIEQTHFLLGNSCPEAPLLSRRPRNSTPERIARYVVDFQTRPDQALLYRLNGDLNPLHSDPTLAVRAGFDKPILHGMCTFAIAVRALLEAVLNYDVTAVREISLRFRSPVYPGETLRTEIRDDLSFSVRALERDVLVADNGQLVRATAAVRSELNHKEIQWKLV